MGRSFLRGAAVGFVCAALGGATVALAGSGVGGVFNLGQSNSVDAKTTLTGASPGIQLQVSNTNTNASTSGLSVDSASGATTGVFTNTGGGPAGGFFVNSGVKPFTVNSQTKVGNLNADLLDGVDSAALQKRVTGTCAVGSAIRVVNDNGTVACQAAGGGAGGWSLTGNAGTTPGTNFLGTTDNQALELKVNGQRALRLEPSSGMINVIGGFSGNAMPDFPIASTIAGGGGPGSPNIVSERFGTVGGGLDNIAGDQDGNSTSASFATVGGGRSNTASGFESTVGGGVSNTAGGGDYSTVAGGRFNTANVDDASVGGGNSNTASGIRASVGGGDHNSAAGLGATVPGGTNNSAGGDRSFAAGNHAQANQQGTFVWADSQNGDMNTSAIDQFIARAQGHFFLQSDSTLDDQGGFINTSTGAFLSTGGTWTNASSRTLKAGFAAVSPIGILEKVASLPLTTWHYKAEPGVRHIGPVAEDFHRAFGVGENARSIGTVDADGVALAAIQGLYRQNTALQRQNHALRARLKALDARLTRLERAVAVRSR